MAVPATIIIIAAAIAAVLYILIKILNSRSLIDREKASPFECGFDPSSSARVPFSLRFFILAIIFIVFDIEIVLLLPTPLLTSAINIEESIIIAITFLLVLLAGLLHEWREGSLDWSS